MAMYYGVAVAEDGVFDPIRGTAGLLDRAARPPRGLCALLAWLPGVLRPALVFFALDDLRRINMLALGLLL